MTSSKKFTLTIFCELNYCNVLGYVERPIDVYRKNAVSPSSMKGCWEAPMGILRKQNITQVESQQIHCLAITI